MLDDDDQELMRVVGRYLKRVERLTATEAATSRTPLGVAIGEHLGVDAASVPVLTEAVPAHRLVDADIALDDLMARSGGTLLGVTGGEQRFHSSVADLISNAYAPFSPGPVSSEMRATGPGTERRVVSFGVRLFHFGGQPIAVVQRGASPRHGESTARLEVLSPDQDAATAVIAELRRVMVDKSVLRGRVLSFVPTEYGSDAGATFVERPDVRSDDIVLEEGVLERVVGHVVGVGEHRDTLRGAGQHLKRGVLLYGPPGTGKTLTVRHLLSLTPETTAVVLTGSSIRFIAAAAEIARTFPPSLVVLEDIDLVAADRGYSPQPILFEVLDALDGLEADADVAFVMTTNHVHILEEALAARPGRVDLGVEIPLPGLVARRRLFRRYAADLPLSDEALDAAAARAEGTTGSFAKELLRRTVLIAAVRGDGAAVTDADLKTALDDLLSSGAALTRLLLGARDGEGHGHVEVRHGASYQPR
ncbi:MAG: ATP-dependent proteasome regulatory subunit [Microbacterium sp.]|jgi:ATP-dependent 26S proteasome regulatory subunit|nr:ATP-dependent proteasome regulatory subunit [Microbacterium sp.]